MAIRCYFFIPSRCLSFLFSNSLLVFHHLNTFRQDRTKTNSNRHALCGCLGGRMGMGMRESLDSTSSLPDQTAAASLSGLVELMFGRQRSELSEIPPHQIQISHFIREQASPQFVTGLTFWIHEGLINAACLKNIASHLPCKSKYSLLGAMIFKGNQNKLFWINLCFPVQLDQEMEMEFGPAGQFCVGIFLHYRQR